MQQIKGHLLCLPMKEKLTFVILINSEINKIILTTNSKVKLIFIHYKNYYFVDLKIN